MVHFLLTSCPFHETSQQQVVRRPIIPTQREENNEKTLSSCPCGIGNQLCFADLRPTKRPGGSTDNPEDPRKFKGFEEAHNNNDAAAIAAFYTRDAVFVTPGGPIIGRQAIQKWFADLFQWWHKKNYKTKVDGNAFHLIGTAGNEAWATGEWSETGQGKHGEPIPIKGYWAAIYVREADDWKIRVEAWNTAPDSVILVDKSFAPQPAATPSPTASPSGQ